jgi:hypothetical protein
MKNNPKPDIHFRITKQQYKYLQSVAKAMDRSTAYLIAKIVTEWIEASQGAPRPSKIDPDLPR